MSYKSHSKKLRNQPKKKSKRVYDDLVKHEKDKVELKMEKVCANNRKNDKKEKTKKQKENDKEPDLKQKQNPKAEYEKMMAHRRSNKEKEDAAIYTLPNNSKDTDSHIPNKPLRLLFGAKDFYKKLETTSYSLRFR